ncbi:MULTISPECIES: DUF6154 family protein [Bacillaceae]|uniref:DUF6154 family protein n=1 Tax=Bacillaceae TaxID=186817 RepID=UPI001BDE7E4F|nr:MULTISPECIES: DUF6154 family protein [Bacillaceae]MDX8359202.1 DUF6154 family protein [Cytobacillus sp. IB215316]MDX8367436.1 DUF6154 family protein [Cytobacillus sp. IB215665]
MKLVDELYDMYRHKLTGDEEDAEILTLALLEQLDRNDILSMVEELSDYELVGLVSLYITEKLKGKIARDGVGNNRRSSISELRNLH